MVGNNDKECLYCIHRSGNFLIYAKMVSLIPTESVWPRHVVEGRDTYFWLAL